MTQHPAYPSLFKSSVAEFVEKPYILDDEKVWQQCYICGMTITFNKDIGKWQRIGGELIRHKDCEPPALSQKGSKDLCTFPDSGGII